MKLARIRAHPVFFAVVAGLALLAVGEAWWLRDRIATVRQNAARHERLLEEERTHPATVTVGTTARAAELADATEELAALQAMFVSGVDEARIPRERAEAYFDLAAFGERMRAEAARQGVEIADNERFGFAEYATSGPEAEAIETVYRERNALERLLTVLFATKPTRLVAVHRARSEARGIERSRRSGEHLDFDERRSVVAEGLLKSRVFRLTFLGRTESVRRMLQRFVELELPVAVRAVDAARVEQGDARASAVENSGEETWVIAGGQTRFAVTVEWLESKSRIQGAASSIRVSQGKQGTTSWAAPEPQSRGAGWIYELFSPPVIYRDAQTQRLSVRAPSERPAVEVAEIAVEVEPETFAMELLEVKRALYPLQLIGYAGAEAEYCGLFEDTTTAETFVVRGAGRRPALGLTIEDFGVRRVTVPLADSMATERLVAQARVRDERSGAVVMLNSLERRLTDEAIAVVAWGDAARREVREGDVIHTGGAVYRVRKIQLRPPALEVSWETPDGGRDERRTLTARDVAVVEPTS